MMELAYRMVDVFASPQPASGNPLAVVLGAEHLSTEQMARFSAWTNLSECTFVLAPTDPRADYRVRIFSLTTELPFAGHPTLGTARAWLDAGGVPRTPGVVVQECGAGLVPVRIQGSGGLVSSDDARLAASDTLAFAAPPLRKTGPVSEAELAGALEVLGVQAKDVASATWIDNGPGWMGILLHSADAVRALEPDLSARAGQWSIGVAGVYPAGGEAQVEVRAFFNDSGGPLREDPVTGSLNASIAQWLLGEGVLSSPYVARQGRAVGADGYVFIDADASDVWVGGRAEVMVRGVLSAAW